MPVERDVAVQRERPVLAGEDQGFPGQVVELTGRLDPTRTSLLPAAPVAISSRSTRATEPGR